MNQQLPVTGHDITRALISQVSKAAGSGSELEVETRISRPLWRLWNTILGVHPDTEPTDWLGEGHTHRVYGSKTIVVDSDGLWSFSRKATILPTFGE